ncbi:MAG: HD domain-containing phosphohydrolase [Pirellulales bacterium]
MHRDGLIHPASDQKTILVVDDEAQMRELLSRWLAGEGWECLQADSAENALARLQSADVQIVVADIHMPGCSGLWLLEQVTNRFRETSVLMLTGSDDTRTAIDALTRGASGYLLKPIQRDEFIFRVRQTAERRQLIHERREYLRTLERRVQEQTLAIRLAHEETIHRLVTAAGCRDEETGAHIRRTGLFSEVLALVAGWSATEAEQLRMAAPMHDVGKIGIPDAILQKPGKLTALEYERMKEHTTIAARMLAGSASPVLQLAEKIALSHHERWDGTGYPQGLAGEAIPEAARIVAIVDVYDALSHDRVYRPALPEDIVLEKMRAGQGTHFDPGLLGLFFSVLEQIRAIAASNPDLPEECIAGSQPSSFPAVTRDNRFQLATVIND